MICYCLYIMAGPEYRYDAAAAIEQLARKLAKDPSRARAIGGHLLDLIGVWPVRLGRFSSPNYKSLTRENRATYAHPTIKGGRVVIQEYAQRESGYGARLGGSIVPRKSVCITTIAPLGTMNRTDSTDRIG